MGRLWFRLRLAGQQESLPPGRRQPAIINDAPGLIVTLDGQLDQTLSIALDGTGRIAGIYVVRNPDKLTGIPSP